MVVSLPWASQVFRGLLYPQPSALQRSIERRNLQNSILYKLITPLFIFSSIFPMRKLRGYGASIGV